MSEDEACKPTGNPLDGWFDYMEDGKLKRRLGDGSIIDMSTTCPRCKKDVLVDGLHTCIKIR